MRRRKTEAWTKWRGLIAEQGLSGQSVAVFCRERRLKSGQFFAWRKRLREAGAAEVRSGGSGTVCGDEVAGTGDAWQGN
jgi:hypothetical protein